MHSQQKLQRTLLTQVLPNYEWVGNYLCGTSTRRMRQHAALACNRLWYNSEGETPLVCAVRALQGKYGLQLNHVSQFRFCETLRVRNPSDQGWHDETLHVFNLDFDGSFAPTN